jgi:hypothetical protein
MEYPAHEMQGSIKVDFQAGTEYLEAHLSGSYSLPGMLYVIDRIADETTKRHLDKVLINVAIEGDARLDDRFKYAEYAARTLKVKKCAAYTGPKQRLEPFTSDVAQNRGLCLEVFGELHAAVRWLTSDGK